MTTHKITIFVDSIFREYVVDEEQLINRDWNEEIASMLDSIKNADNV